MRQQCLNEKIHINYLAWNPVCCKLLVIIFIMNTPTVTFFSEAFIRTYKRDSQVLLTPLDMGTNAAPD